MAPARSKLNKLSEQHSFKLQSSRRGLSGAWIALNDRTRATSADWNARTRVLCENDNRLQFLTRCCADKGHGMYWRVTVYLGDSVFYRWLWLG